MRELRTLGFRLGGVLALLALLVAGVWLALPHIMRAIIQSIAERNGLESVIIEIESVRWDHATIRRLAFETKTAYGPIFLDLRGLTTRYQLSAMALSAVGAESGDLTWRQESAEGPMPTIAAAPRLPPLPPINIKRMQVSLDTRSGRSTFTGPMKLAKQADKFAVSLSDRRQTLQVVTDPEFVSATITITSDGESVAVLTANHPFSDNSTVEGSARLHRLRTWSHDNPLVPGDMRATLKQLTMDEGSLSVRGQLTYDAGRYVFDGQGQASWRGWRQPEMVLGAQIDFRLTITNNQWRIAALPKSRLMLTDVHWGDEKAVIDIPKAQFDVQAEAQGMRGSNGWRTTIDSFSARTSALEIFLDPDTPVRTQHLELTGKVTPATGHNRVELRASASQPSLPSLQITAESLRAQATFETDRRLRTNGTFFAAGVRMQDWPKTMRDLSLTGQFDHHDRKITAQGEAKIQKRKIANWRVEPKDASRSMLRTTAEFDIATLWPYIKPLFDKSWDRLTFASGVFTGDAEFIWNDAMTSTMTLRGTGIKGRYEDTEFTDLGIELTSRDVVAADYEVRVSIEQAKAAGNIMISNVGVNFHFHDQTIDLAAASWHSFGGEFAVEPTIVTLEHEDHRLRVSVAGLDFGQALAMIDQPGLSGTGRLEGTIPLAFVRNGIEIKDAELHSTVPGTLRYLAGGSAAAPVDNIALQALQDFRYDSMKIWIDYKPDGAYRIRLRLEGRNPSLYNGYPIAFNLNLTGELPDLLRTGILTGDFSKQILKDIQSDRLAK